MSYQYHFSCGPYASNCYISLNGTNIFRFQLDYGCSNETHFDIYHNNKWSSIKSCSELSHDIKELFILAANNTITNLEGYSVISDNAIKDLKHIILT
jgi:hypothetical protein